jgi:hypothetical protein
MASIYGSPKLELISSGLQLYIDPSIVAPIGTTVYDVKNKYNPVSCGTINNSGGVYSTSFGGIFQLNGSNQSITITTPQSFSAGCTIQVMLRRSNAGNGQYTTFSTVFGSRSSDKLICFDGSSGTQNYSLESNNNGGAAVSPVFKNDIPDWYLLTYINSNATNGLISLYKNNQSTAYSINGSIATGTLNLRIGEDYNNGRFFKGDIGAFLFYNRVLTFPEIANNYYNFSKKFNI